MIILWFLLFIFGFICLWKGGDWLTDSASDIATHFNVSALFIIGMTIVAFGTSLPELFVNILALIRNNHTLVFGNVIGSNISNTWLILGSAAILCPLTLKKELLYKKLMLNILAPLVLILMLFPRFQFLARHSCNKSI